MGNADTKAESVYKIEYAMAESFNSRLENRNPQTTYNKIKGNELVEVYTDINWSAFFKGMKLNTPKEVNVNQPKYIRNLGKILNSYFIDAWKGLPCGLYGEQLYGLFAKCILGSKL
ncbi:MAG: hypothetical protein ACK5L5_05055 [Bacteroidales bacterium]